MRFLTAIVVVMAGAASAQMAADVDRPAAPAKSSSFGELMDVRLRYGVALRSGNQNDIGPGLTYSGLTPNDIGLSGSYFGRGWIGGALSLQREGFALFGDDGKVTAGSLLRGHAGPTARVVLGPLRIEGLIGYQLVQLPGFKSSLSPEFSVATRHSALLAGRAMVDVGPLTAEARGEFPIPFAMSTSTQGKSSSSGFAAAASLGYVIGNYDRLAYGVLVDYQFVSDRLSESDGAIDSAQSLSRIGLALQMKWLEAVPPPPPPRFGGLLVSVVDADSGAPIEAASVEISHDGDDKQPLSAGSDGKFSARKLEPGSWVAVASAGGYLAGEATGSITAGKDAAIEVRIKKEPPKVGSLIVSVLDRETNEPLAGAAVLVKEVEYLADEKGAVSLVDLQPGPLQINVRAKGYKLGSEVASIVAFKKTEVTVAILKEERKALATITGLVRSTRGGKPVAADLELPQAKIKTTANEKGAFTFKVEGGTYTVNIAAPGFLSQSKSVTVRDGDQAIFNVDLHPK